MIAAVPERPRRPFAHWVLALLLACGASVSPATADTAMRPQRIVSLNACTDQLLLRLVEPERILSLTFLSYEKEALPPEFRPLLKSFKPNHGLAEEVLTMQPDLVVTGTYSSKFTTTLLRRLGRNVVEFAPDNSFDEMYAGILRMGDAVGEPERAEKLVADFRSRLASLRAQIPPGETPVYADIDVNFWMPGKDTLYTQVVNAGGFRTAGEVVGYSGYQPIPLEQLIRIEPEVVSTTSTYESPPSMATQNLRHPLLRRMAANAKATLNIPGRYVVCATPETLDLVQTLVETRKKLAGK